MTDKKIYVSNFLLPFISCMYAAVNILAALYKTEDIDGTNYLLLIAVCLGSWLLLVVQDYKKDNQGMQAIWWEAGAVLLLFVVLSYSCINMYWSRGYTALNPVELIDNGRAHIDILYHSAYAEGYSTSFPSSALINNNLKVPYHTFSHFLVWVLSKLLCTTAYLVYNYIFPLIFVPLYLYGQIFAISKAKSFFKEKSKFCFLDYVFIVLMNVGFFWFEKYCGIWRSSFILSQSFLVSLTVCYFFCGIVFSQLKKESLKAFFIFIVIPLALFLTIWGKVSTGGLLTCAVLYYLLRHGKVSIGKLILAGYYGIVFIGAIYLSYWGTVANGATQAGFSFHAFSFRHHCANNFAYILHFLLIDLPGILFLLFEFKEIRNKNKKWNVWIEILILVSVIGFLPVIVMNIPGGSGAYFSYVVEVPGIILLCGNDYLNIDKYATYKKYVKTIVCCLAVMVAFNCFKIVGVGRPFKSVKGAHKTQTYNSLMEIRKIVQQSPKEYCLFVEPDTLGNLYRDSRAEVFLYPGLTGAMLINATYLHDGKYYNFKDTKVANYVMNFVTNDKLSLDDALVKAREYGKRKMIYIKKGEGGCLDYEVLNI